MKEKRKAYEDMLDAHLEEWNAQIVLPLNLCKKLRMN